MENTIGMRDFQASIIKRLDNIGDLVAAQEEANRLQETANKLQAEANKIARGEGSTSLDKVIELFREVEQTKAGKYEDAAVHFLNQVAFTADNSFLVQIYGYATEGKWSYKYAGFAEYGDRILYFEVINDEKSSIFVHNVRIYNKKQAFKLVSQAVNMFSNVADGNLYNITTLEFFYEDLVFAVMKQSDIDGFAGVDSNTVWGNLVSPTIEL